MFYQNFEILNSILFYNQQNIRIKLSFSFMKQEELFLNNLLDFSNLNSKRTDFQQSAISSHSNKINSYHQNKTLNQVNLQNENFRLSQPIIKNSGNDCLNNEKILKTFNGLRQKLSQTNRENISLKQEQQNYVKQLQQYQQKEKHYMCQIQTLHKKYKGVQQQLSQYKHRLNNLKQTISKNEINMDQIQHLKFSCLKLTEDNRKLKQQSSVAMQISIQEKMQIQQQIQSLRLRQIESSKSTQQAQDKLSSKNKQFIKLQNQYRKLKLIYDQQVYTKKMNSQLTILHRQNQQLKLKYDQIQSKLKKERNRKYQLETKLLQLQEKVRLYGTKTDIYQGQLDSITKKMKKVQFNQQQTKKQANQALNQKLSWEQKFYNATIVCEELVFRVKRQLHGDVFDLAKTCEYRINKLKNDQKLDFKDKIIVKRSKSISKKVRSQSQKNKKNNACENQQQQKQIQRKQIQRNMQRYDQKTSKNDQFSKTILKDINFSKKINENGLEEVKKKLFNQLQTSSKNGLYGSLNDGGLKKSNLYKNQEGDSVKDLSLEAKIRKQRELMQKKLRQKILYHKLQDATSSPMKNKLRQQYFNIATMDF